MLDLTAAALTEEEQALLPTPEDVAFYREHGWYISRRIFSDEEIDAAIEGSERFYAGNRADFALPDGPGEKLPRGWVPEHGDVLRKNDYASLQNRELRALVDGGFTTWTQQPLSNRKERLLISGLGIERFSGLVR
jgi:hypothetical protein